MMSEILIVPGTGDHHPALEGGPIRLTVLDTGIYHPRWMPGEDLPASPGARLTRLVRTAKRPGQMAVISGNGGKRPMRIASRFRAAARAAAAVFILLHFSGGPTAGASNTPGAGTEIRVACFLAAGFPTADAPAVSPDSLRAALNGLSSGFFSDPPALSRALDEGGPKVLLLPYGSAFPAEAWPAIRNFLKRGGSLVYLGGNPFSLPVYRDGDGWKSGTPQPTFAHELLIGPADRIDIGSRPFYAGARVSPVAGSGFAAEGFPMPARVFELTVRFTTDKYFRDEDGGNGPREAVLRPLVHVINGDGLAIACPLLAIDRIGGEAAGGRWVFGPSDAALPASLIRECVELALQGASEMKVLPVHALVREGETPVIRIVRSRPDRDLPSSPASETFVVEVRDPSGKSVFRKRVPVSGTAGFSSTEAAIRTRGPLRPGLYTVDVLCPGSGRLPDRASGGFRVADPKLPASGPKLSAGRDWLFKDGRPFPVVGTTYMASDVAREFLFEPNPLVWARDFAEMRRAGVNMIRTGIWTGWRRIALAPSAFDEGVLRAIEAFVETAAENGIAVCFNFFAFSPPADGGTNPYLDPRALRWQKAFVTAIVSRFRDCGWIHYDLINEPSYTPPDDLWKTLPIGDGYEREAWQAWLLKRHPGGRTEMMDDWRSTGGGTSAPPAAADMSYAMIRNNREPRKALDFSLFTQDAVTGWAAALTREIKAAGGGLVTLGQDEGGAVNRPKHQFFHTAVDYTSIHNWWFNDDLLWDVVSTKVPEKPNLVSETGLMRLEDIDGNAWRDPDLAARLLERKFAYAFMGRGAGVLEWVWNINPYMPIDNESVIGFKRPDGTFKLESEVLKAYAAFFAEAAPRLGDFEPERVVLLSPDARMFSGQPQALEGTQRLIRVLAEDFGLVPAMLSDLTVTAERLTGARLVIVPSAQWLPDTASRALLSASRTGTVVLFTGAVEGNEYGKPSADFKALGLEAGSAPVAHYETAGWASGGKEGTSVVSFGGLKSENLRKSLAPPASLRGVIIHEPLPLEYAEERGPLDALLEAVLRRAGLPSEVKPVPVASKVLLGAWTALAVLANESLGRLDGRVSFDGRVFDVPVDAGRSRIVLFDRRSGAVILTGGGGPAGDIKPVHGPKQGA